MIELRSITKKYGELTVYDDFSLSLEEGKITCILGESGCGKTTLLNMLAGVCPYEGEITPRQPCSYIFQQPRLVPNLTVAGNLSLVCKDRARIADMLSRAGLSEKAGAYPVELSGGQAQRVSVARAFLNPARLILMDEPFSSLDTALKIRMIGLFCEIWREESAPPYLLRTTRRRRRCSRTVRSSCGRAGWSPTLRHGASRPAVTENSRLSAANWSPLCFRESRRRSYSDNAVRLPHQAAGPRLLLPVQSP